MGDARGRHEVEHAVGEGNAGPQHRREHQFLARYLRRFHFRQRRLDLDIGEWQIAGKKLVFAPVLRAGVTFAEGMLDLVPNARVAHIGLYREPETFVAVEYFFKAPSDLHERLVIVISPVLATANSAVAAVDRLKERGANDIRLVCLIGVPEGIERMRGIHPDVPIWLAAVDDGLDENAYILPGLGDAGDRAYGTK